MGVASDYADNNGLNYYVVIPFTDVEPAKETVTELEDLGLHAAVAKNRQTADHEVWIHCRPQEAEGR
jgi:hypothetical protein